MEQSDNSTPVIATTRERLRFIVCQNSQGAEVKGILHRLTRCLGVFEVSNPYNMVQPSEVLHDFRIMTNERAVYSGRSVITNFVNTGIMLICEASLSKEGWSDTDIFSPNQNKDRLLFDFREFLKEAEKNHRVLPDFKLIVADVHPLHSDLRGWVAEVKLGLRSMPSGGDPMPGRIVAEHNGRISFKSKLGPFTEFTFEFPSVKSTASTRA